MLGAIVGDVIGSIYEWNNIKTKAFPLFAPACQFTDDTVLTVALADAILHERDYGALMRDYYARYPDAGYGGRFHDWARATDPAPYNSWGNGAAMRISPVGYVYATLEETMQAAARFTAVTHNHPEGIKGGQSVAAAIFLARTGHGKTALREFVEANFGYDLSFTLDEIRPTYEFNESCQETVPQAFAAFLESTDFEDAIRNAVSLGGDTDTLACITGSLAEAFYGGVPESIAAETLARLDDPLRAITTRFLATYPATARSA